MGRLLSSEVTSRIAFGNSYIEGKNIFEMLTKLGFIIYKIFLTIRVPVIRKKEEKAMARGEGRFGSDYLGLLVEAQHDDNDNQRISADKVVDDCKTFYMSGQETTTTLLSWTVFLLAVHTDWQEEARKEVIQLFGKETPHSDGIAKLKIMSMIINESLWLYPPLVSIIRKVEREVRLGKLTLPPNLDLVISTIAIHHDPEIWGEDVHLSNQRDFWKGLLKQLTTT
ncbi:Cytochrome P450 superfamily protein [Prunus dulcis]|uniref:Cytochrome P450 superfamily protein n=1 Tax=Prunus dulcis TaxID=3755 RepID=A0A4Y1RWW8_PRUDU|nr:Cytochrome P450 superfamily protein [Prunus dulcis]